MKRDSEKLRKLERLADPDSGATESERQAALDAIARISKLKPARPSCNEMPEVKIKEPVWWVKSVKVTDWEAIHRQHFLDY